MKHLLLLLVLGIFLFSCNKNDDMLQTSENYLVFGHFYGFCGGEECVEIFKLEGERLYEDMEDNYPSTEHPYMGNFQILPDTTYDKVADLPDHFPSAIFNRMDTVFGMPDAYDQGGLYIERKTEDQHDYWLIDQDTTNIPVFLHDFHQKVNKAIERIQN